MGKVTLAAALFFSVVACEVVVTPKEEKEVVVVNQEEVEEVVVTPEEVKEVVVTPEEEANRSPSFIEYLLAHAEVVDRYQQEGPCPEVQDEV